MLLAIIDSIEDDVLEGHSSLACEVCLTDHLEGIHQRKATFGRHELKAPFVEGVMKAHRQMAGRLREEAL